MAEGDEKKGEKKESSTFWSALDVVEWLVIGIILFAGAIQVEHFFAGGKKSVFNLWLVAQPNIVALGNDVRLWLASAARSLTAFSNGLSLFLILLIGYITFRRGEVHKVWYKNLYPLEKKIDVHGVVVAVSAAAKTHPTSHIPANLPTSQPLSAFSVHTVRQNPRWQKVLEHIASDNPSDWRLAILEADIVLEETLDQVGYAGDTVGDKLKNAERRPFASLNAAWEAHRIRNAIAHQGQGFDVTQREAQRVIALFEGVFRELGSV